MTEHDKGLGRAKKLLSPLQESLMRTYLTRKANLSFAVSFTHSPREASLFTDHTSKQVFVNNLE